MGGGSPCYRRFPGRQRGTVACCITGGFGSAVRVGNYGLRAAVAQKDSRKANPAILLGVLGEISAVPAEGETSISHFPLASELGCELCSARTYLWEHLQDVILRAEGVIKKVAKESREVLLLVLD